LGRLLNMKERTKRLRRLGVRGTIAAFLAAWAIVFGQLVLGHDPALGGQKTAQTQPKATTQSNDTGSSAGDTSTSSGDTGSSLSTPAPAPVTTSQS
jgi:hypothetical protein